MWTDMVPAVLLIVLGLATIRIFEHAARSRHGGDSARFWASVSFGSALWLGAPVLVSSLVVPLLPAALQRTGWHLQPDLSGGLGMSARSLYLPALALPWLVWALILAFALLRPRCRRRARGLDGATGFSADRRWVLVCAVPLGILALAAAPQLGGGVSAYPAVTWSSLVVVGLSLAALAWSRVPSGAQAASGAVGDASRPSTADLPAWEPELRRRGIDITPLWSRPAKQLDRTLSSSAALALTTRLRSLQAGGVAPELIDAVSVLIAPAAPGEETRREILVLAPEDCGQAEVVALTAETVARRFLQNTLVVTAGDADTLASRLRSWVTTPAMVEVATPRMRPIGGQRLLVTDAEVLSDHLLRQFSGGEGLGDLGMIVWWDLHAFTGVLGANLWAVSRRLYRLVRKAGRSDVRTLALMRDATYGGQLGRFVRRLLPQAFAAGEVRVPRRFPVPVDVHLLRSCRRLLDSGGASDVPERARHPSLLAAMVSAQTRSPTWYRPADDVARSEVDAVFALPFDGSPLVDRLATEPARASATVLTLDAADVLALPEIAAYSGRAADPARPHHLLLDRSRDPYVRHLLSSVLDGDEGFSDARLLVCAEGHPSILRRHLLLALDEAPATLEDLLRDFLHREDLIRETLDELAGDGKLDRCPVRYLRPNGELGRSFEYQSRRPAVPAHRPLDTVGGELIDVLFDEGARGADEGVHLRVDSDRLVILAYPYRVFLHAGRRYRIREWSSIDRARQRGGLECREESSWSRTWRIRRNLLFDLRWDASRTDVARAGRGLGLSLVSAGYRETVTGVLELTRDPETGRESLVSRNVEPLWVRFQTRALVLHLPAETDRTALHSLAQALRHLLPVHLGVGEHDLEVVPLADERKGGTLLNGVAITDLYPGGVGLLEAIADDNNFILSLLEHGRHWLSSCRCDSEEGCEDCLRSPAARAVRSEHEPSRGAALRLLEEILSN